MRSGSGWPSTGSPTSASRRPTCSSRREPSCSDVARQACTATWGSRTGTPNDRPTRTERSKAHGRSSWPHGRTSPTPIPNIRRPKPAPTPESAATPGSITTRRCAQALRDVCRQIRRADHRAVAFADDNSIVDRAVAHRAGLGWYGKNANLLLPGVGSWYVLGCIVTTAPYEPTAGAGRRRMRHVPALHRRLPDRRDHRPRSDRRQPLPQLGAAEAGSRSRSSTARRSATASTAATTARTPARSRCVSGRGKPIELDPDCRRLGRRTRAPRRRRRLDRRPVRPLVRRRPGSPLGATQRAGRGRQRRRSGRWPRPASRRPLPFAHRSDPRRTRRLGRRPPRRTRPATS